MCINDAAVATAGHERLQSPFGLKMSRTSKRNGANRHKSVLLVDRHALMRWAAASWINRCPVLEVCGSASGMAQAFQSINRLRPDGVVSEILRPQDLGFIRDLHRRHPHFPILVSAPAECMTRRAPASAISSVNSAKGRERFSGGPMVRSGFAVLDYRPCNSAKETTQRS